MNESTENAAGGDLVGRDKIIHGDEVHGDKVVGDKNVYVSTSSSFLDDLPRYDKLIRGARERMKLDILPQLWPLPSPLSYYQLIRPKHSSSFSPQEVEVWVALISNVPQRIRMLKISPPKGTNPIRQESIAPGTEIGPFGTLRALRYVVSTAIPRLDPRQPSVVYQVSGDETRYETLSELPWEPTRDDIELFVPLVDREDLLSQIDRCLEKTIDGTSQWLAIAGEWGDGRSRALAECINAARRLGFDVLEKATAPVSVESERWDVIREAIVDKLDLTGDLEDDVFYLIKWLEGEEQHFSQGERYRLFGNAGIRLMVRYLQEGVEGQQYFGAIARGILQRAFIKPLLLAIDDFHNAPRSTFDIIRYLAKQLAKAPGARLVVCVSYDPEKCDSQIRSYLQPWTVYLRDLTETDVIEFAQKLYPALRPPGGQEFLFHFLGKKPLLIRQGLGHLSRAGHIRLKHGHWQFGSAFDPDLSFRHSVDETEGLGILWFEYKDLPPTERLGLQMAAAIGVDFEYDLLEEAMLDPELGIALHKRDVLDRVEELKRKDFVLSLPGKMYRINPPVLRQFILDDIQKDSSLAAQLHGLIARLLAKRADSDPIISGRLAYQLLWSQEPSNMPEAFERFRELALDSSKHQHLDNTIALYERALDAAQISQGRISQNVIYKTWYDLAQALDARGHWQEALQRASWLATNCEDEGMHQLTAEAYILAGWVSQELGDMVKAQRYYDYATVLVQAYEMPEIEARLLRKQATWYSKQNLSDKVLECYEQALQLRQSAEDLVQVQIGYADNLRRRNRLDEAHSFIKMALEKCAELSTFYVAATNLNAGALSYNMRDFDKSTQYLERARDLAESVGAQREQASAESWLGSLYRYLDLGPSERAVYHYFQAAELFELLGDKDAATEAYRECIRALVETGMYEAAVQVSGIANWCGIVDTEIDGYRDKAQEQIARSREISKN